MSVTLSPKLRGMLRRQTAAIVIAAVLLVAGLGGWAMTTEFSGAVIAAGQLVVDSNVKKVQHPTGGVVGSLNVREGQEVKAGDIVISLDDTQIRANRDIVVKALNELAARQAREEAERDGLDKVTFPAELIARKSDPDVAMAVTGEQRQFEIRRTSREGQKAQLRERMVQLRQEIGGYEAQITSKDKQIEWVGKELVGVYELWEKNLIPYTRVTSLEREKERLVGERGQLTASIAQSKGKIAEIELQILQVDQDMRTEVGKDLAEIRARTAEMVERKVSAEDQLKRVDIRAPIDGVVLQLTVHTVGGVITAGEASGGEGSAAGDRPDSDRAARGVAFRGLQPAHHARAERRGGPDIGRCQRGYQDRRTLLHHQARRVAGGSRAAGRRQAGAGHAGRDSDPNEPTHRDVLSGQAATRSARACLPREIKPR